LIAAAAPVSIIDLVLLDTPASTIATLKKSGKKVICYLSAGTYEDWRSDAKSFPSSVLLEDMDDWPGEKWLKLFGIADGSSPLIAIMKARIQMAKTKGCDAIDVSPLLISLCYMIFDIDMNDAI